MQKTIYGLTGRGTYMTPICLYHFALRVARCRKHEIALQRDVAGRRDLIRSRGGSSQVIWCEGHLGQVSCLRSDRMEWLLRTLPYIGTPKQFPLLESMKRSHGRNWTTSKYLVSGCRCGGWVVRMGLRNRETEVFFTPPCHRHALTCYLAHC